MHCGGHGDERGRVRAFSGRRGDVQDERGLVDDGLGQLLDIGLDIVRVL